MTAVAGFLAMLDEQEPQLRQYALEKLDGLVPSFWAEIAHSLKQLVSITEEASGADEAQRQLAALLISKVNYHLGDLDAAMKYAFDAGPLFNVQARTEFVNTLVAQCIDQYIGRRLRSAEVDPRLEAIVDGMFERCFADGAFKQALGIAVEAHRLDLVKASLLGAEDVHKMLNYCFRVSKQQIISRDWRHRVQELLVELYGTLEQPDYLRQCQILIFLNDPARVASILGGLVQQAAADDADNVLIAYQASFDLCESASQQFLAAVRSALPTVAAADPSHARFEQLHTILSGEKSVALQLDFLSRHNKSDLGLLKNIKESIEVRNLVPHNATVFANAIMHAGTTNDQFLRENLEWLQRSTHWARFSAAAGLGVMHKGHLTKSKQILGPYLPATPPGSPYSEGGSLYALGLVHANHGGETTKFLVDQLDSVSNPILQHGACLGIGLAAMATGDQDIFKKLYTVARTENAVAGEAAALAMGLVMLGTANGESLQQMIEHAHETEHEKIIRGYALGIAMLMYGREEEADTLIEQLVLDKDPILRYGAMYTVALAYCGTANNAAIRRLLHMAVSDVSDDVRRAAVTALGFVLLQRPRECPDLVRLLAGSYNPHVRYGATLAVGISCAGSALSEAIDLLLPMTKDPVDFVRQGAMIALSMVLIQSTEVEEPRVAKVRALLLERVSDKHEETMAKFGAILATGIMNAGGRNVTISLSSRFGHMNMPAIVGVAVFTQFWYWYPLTHFVTLAFTPTAVIGVNAKLQSPKWSFRSEAPPSRFAYPPDYAPPKTVARTKLSTAVLSTTKKAQKRADQKARLSRSQSGMDTTEDEVATSATDKTEAATDVDQKKADGEQDEDAAAKGDAAAKAAEPEPEATFEQKENPARITPRQVQYVRFDDNARYVPIKKRDVFGILILRDTMPDEPVELANPAPAKEGESATTATGGSSSSAAAAPSTDADGDAVVEDAEPAPPAAFEFDDDDDDDDDEMDA